MTPRTALFTSSLALSAALLLVVVTLNHATSARREADHANSRLLQVRAEGQAVLSLRAQTQTVARGEQPSSDLYQRVTDVLQRTGLEHLQGVSITPGRDQALDGQHARRLQTARVTMGPMPLDELGSFLNRWRNEQALWTVEGVDLTRPHTRGAPDASYSVALTMSAVYVSDTLGEESGTP